MDKAKTLQEILIEINSCDDHNVKLKLLENLKEVIINFTSENEKNESNKKVLDIIKIELEQENSQLLLIEFEILKEIFENSCSSIREDCVKLLKVIIDKNIELSSSCSILLTMVINQKFPLKILICFVLNEKEILNSQDKKICEEESNKNVHKEISEMEQSNKSESKYLSFVNKLSEIIKVTPMKTRIEFLLNVVLPEMFDLDFDSLTRHKYIELLYAIYSQIPIVHFNDKSLSEFRTKLKEIYIPKALKICEEEIDAKYCPSENLNWPRISSFLFRYLGTFLHTDIDLINALLKIIEMGFRSKKTVHMMLAYNCWFEVIQNYSMKEEYLAGPKQIKLILKPLKAKLTKCFNVLLQRFQIWLHLLKCLKQKANIVLEDFFTFCFSPYKKFGVEKQCKEIFPKVVDVFINILRGNCNDVFYNEKMEIFEYPLVNSSNFHTNYEIIVENIIECCCWLVEESSSVEAKEKVVNCILCTLTNLCCECNEEFKEKIIDSVLKEFTFLIKQQNQEYFNQILMPLFQINNSELIVENLYLPLGSELVKTELNMTDDQRSKLLNIFILKTQDLEKKLNRFKQLSLLFFKDNQNNFPQLYLLISLWLSLEDTVIFIHENIANENSEIQKQKSMPNTKENGSNKVETFEKLFAKHFSGDLIQSFINFLLWPLKLNPEQIIFQDIFQKWKSLSYRILSFSKEIRYQLIKKIKDCIITQPEFIRNAIVLLNSFVQQISQEIVEKSEIELVLKVLNTIAIAVEHYSVHKFDLEDFFNLFEKTVLFFLKFENINNKEIEVFILCFNFFLKNKFYALLPTFYNFLQKIPNTYLISYVPQNLLEHLEELTSSEIQTTSYFAEKIILILKNNVRTPPVSSRVVKMNSMAQKIVSPDMKKTNSYNVNSIIKKTNSPSITQKSMSPHTDSNYNSPDLSNIIHFATSKRKNESTQKIKGSILNQHLFKKNKNSVNKIPQEIKKPVSNLEDDSNAQFVFIDSEVKFDQSKLNEHQKEMLKRRKEDIPALYEDLTQSQSSSLDFATDENSIKIQKIFENSLNSNFDVRSEKGSLGGVINESDLLDSKFNETKCADRLKTDGIKLNEKEHINKTKSKDDTYKDKNVESKEDNTERQQIAIKIEDKLDIKTCEEESKKMYKNKWNNLNKNKTKQNDVGDIKKSKSSVKEDDNNRDFKRNEVSAESSKSSSVVKNSKNKTEPSINELIQSVNKRKNVINNIKLGLQRNEIALPDDISKVMTEYYLEDGSELVQQKRVEPESQYSLDVIPSSIEHKVNENYGKSLKQLSRQEENEVSKCVGKDLKSTSETETLKSKQGISKIKEHLENASETSISEERLNTLNKSAKVMNNAISNLKKKLSINIVGAEDFFNINSKRRSRKMVSNEETKAEKKLNQKQEKIKRQISNKSKQKILRMCNETEKIRPIKRKWDEIKMQSNNEEPNIRKRRRKQELKPLEVEFCFEADKYAVTEKGNELNTEERREMHIQEKKEVVGNKEKDLVSKEQELNAKENIINDIKSSTRKKVKDKVIEAKEKKCKENEGQSVKSVHQNIERSKRKNAKHLNSTKELTSEKRQTGTKYNRWKKLSFIQKQENKKKRKGRTTISTTSEKTSCDKIFRNKLIANKAVDNKGQCSKNVGVNFIIQNHLKNNSVDLVHQNIETVEETKIEGSDGKNVKVLNSTKELTPKKRQMVIKHLNKSLPIISEMISCDKLVENKSKAIDVDRNQISIKNTENKTLLKKENMVVLNEKLNEEVNTKNIYLKENMNFMTENSLKNNSVPLVFRRNSYTNCLNSAPCKDKSKLFKKSRSFSGFSLDKRSIKISKESDVTYTKVNLEGLVKEQKLKNKGQKVENDEKVLSEQNKKLSSKNEEDAVKKIDLNNQNTEVNILNSLEGAQKINNDTQNEESRTSPIVIDNTQTTKILKRKRNNSTGITKTPNIENIFTPIRKSTRLRKSKKLVDYKLTEMIYEKERDGKKSVVSKEKRGRTIKQREEEPKSSQTIECPTDKLEIPTYYNKKENKGNFIQRSLLDSVENISFLIDKEDNKVDLEKDENVIESSQETVVTPVPKNIISSFQDIISVESDDKRDVNSNVEENYPEAKNLKTVYSEMNGNCKKKDVCFNTAIQETFLKSKINISETKLRPETEISLIKTEVPSSETNILESKSTSQQYQENHSQPMSICLNSKDTVLEFNQIYLKQKNTRSYLENIYSNSENNSIKLNESLEGKNQIGKDINLKCIESPLNYQETNSKYKEIPMHQKSTTLKYISESSLKGDPCRNFSKSLKVSEQNPEQDSKNLIAALENFVAEIDSDNYSFRPNQELKMTPPYIKETQSCNPDDLLSSSENKCIENQFMIKSNLISGVNTESDIFNGLPLTVTEKNVEDDETLTANFESEIISLPLENSLRKNELLPTSPVDYDTPAKNSEFIDNTLNISPIKSTTLTAVKLFEDGNSENINMKEEIPWKNLSDKSLQEEAKEDFVKGDVFKKENSLNSKTIKGDDFTSAQDTTLTISEDTTLTLREDTFLNNDIALKEDPITRNLNKQEENNLKKSNTQICLKQPSSRSVKLLNLLPNTQHLTIKPKVKSMLKQQTNSVSSPKTDRIKKIILNCESPSQIGIDKIDFNDFEDNSENIANYEFSYTADSNEVLKFTRELPKATATPKGSILKRKIPDTVEEGISPCPKRKRVNFSDPPTSEKKIFYVDPEEHTPVKVKKKPALPFNQLFDDFLDSFRSQNREFDAAHEERQAILEVKNTDEDIIFPSLVKCPADISMICYDLIPPNLSVRDLNTFFFDNNIHTVGELASLKESDILSFPLQLPKILCLKKALENFKIKWDSKETLTHNTNKEKDSKMCMFKESSTENKLLKPLIENLKSLPKERFINVVKTVFNMQTKSDQEDILNSLLS